MTNLAILLLANISKVSAQEFLEAKPKAKTLETVSYTHLRAHETVLDLVCRLLLEKKQTKKKKKQFFYSLRRTSKLYNEPSAA